VPCLPERLYTPGKRIALAPPELLGDVPRLEASLDAPRDPAGLELIGRRDVRSNNSWLHNSQRLVKGPPRCTLRMHPDDAAARGLAGGQTVRVRSRAGEVEVPLEISAEMMPGVVSMPHGWGHKLPGTALRVAEAHAGASVNDLTDETFLDTFSGNAGFSGVPVVVEAGPRAAAQADG
jgi:anaerobic selenocysteine-containing dehydrogenase